MKRVMIFLLTALSLSSCLSLRSAQEDNLPPGFQQLLADLSLLGHPDKVDPAVLKGLSLPYRDEMAGASFSSRRLRIPSIPSLSISGRGGIKSFRRTGRGKPITTYYRIKQWNTTRSFSHLLARDDLVSVARKLFTNPKSGQVATKIPISGDRRNHQPERNRRVSHFIGES